MTKQSRTLLGGALLSVLALAVAVPGAGAVPGAAPAAAAAVPVGLGPWGAPAPLAGVTAVLDLKSTSDGTAVGVFRQGGQTVVRIRPAGAGTWQQAAGVAPGQLHRTDDGALTLLWSEPAAAGSGQSTVKLARLAAGATAFGAATEVVTTTIGGGLTFAGNAAGRQVLAWMDADRRLTVVERSAPQGAWTAPVQLDRLPEPIVRPDNVYDYRLTELRVAVAADGATALLWGGNSHYTGDGVDPDETAYQWHFKALDKPAGAGAWSAPRDLAAQLGDKPSKVTLTAHPQGGFQLLSGHGGYSRKPAGGDWGAVQAVGIGAAELLTAPGGEVTAVGWMSSGTLAVSTLAASGGAWSAPLVLTQNAVADSLSAVRSAATGQVVVTYAEKRYESSKLVRQDLVTRTLGRGTASKPRTLNTMAASTDSAGRVTTDAKGAPVAVWTETARAVEAGGAASAYTATTGARALPKWHDYADDTRADILGLAKSGAMNLVTQDAANAPRTYQVGTWPDGTRVVPFGDFDGDRCNDLIVRLATGEARLYTPVCGGVPRPDSAYKRLATDWRKYDVLISSGDLTGDKRPDFLARDAASGDLYLYAHDGASGFKARVKIASGLTGYKRLIGAGDLNGDGIGDVLAIDTSNELWRLNGTGTGKLKDRVLVFKDWGTSYKEVIGAGDVNGDGKQDLVSLDTSNRVWLNAGNGTGGFANRVDTLQAAALWQAWASLG
ncbi:VCBS repeat-containing protein [Streptomyces sp. NPDC002054]|uniref:FG-GAP repeat domain-containing protein n=1 Tax=Streptomyces sp. NPDC002054 TaxID=3154663 RepID=UPI00331EA12C